MKKPATPVTITRKVAAELAVASALMLGAGAFAFGPATVLSADNSDGTTSTVMAYRYSPAQ